MIFTTVPLAQAEGALLAHGQLVGTTRWAKGRRLTREDLGLAAAAGLNQLTIARLDPDDIDEDTAAGELGAALAGSGLRRLAPVHGRCNLAATAAGLLTLAPAAVDAVNALDEALTLSTLPPHARVAAGDIVATVKVIRYAVARPILEAACAAARPITVLPFVPRACTLLTTRLPGVADKALAKTARITRARIEALGSRLETRPALPHAIAPLAEAIAANPSDMILIAGASASVDRADVVPAAIIAAGGQVLRLGMPVDPGNLLVLGEHAGRPVIGLPGCARSPRRNGLDMVLERLAAGLPVTAADIAFMGVGGLLPEAERPDPQPR